MDSRSKFGSEVFEVVSAQEQWVEDVSDVRGEALGNAEMELSWDDLGPAAGGGEVSPLRRFSGFWFNQQRNLLQL